MNLPLLPFWMSECVCVCVYTCTYILHALKNIWKALTFQMHILGRKVWSLSDSAIGQRSQWPRVSLSSGQFLRVPIEHSRSPLLTGEHGRARRAEAACSAEAARLCRYQEASWWKLDSVEPCSGVHPENCLDRHYFAFYSFLLCSGSILAEYVLCLLFHLRKDLASLVPRRAWKTCLTSLCC